MTRITRIATLSLFAVLLTFAGSGGSQSCLLRHFPGPETTRGRLGIRPGTTRGRLGIGPGKPLREAQEQAQEQVQVTDQVAAGGV